MFKKIARIAVLFATIVSPLFVNAQQQTSRPDRGISAGNGTQQASEIDSINLQNGSLAVQIPLASLPPMAGGKLGFTLTAFYNSKLWNVYRSEEHPAVQTVPGCASIYTTETVQKADSPAGWRVGGLYEIFFRNATDEFGYIHPTSETCFGREFYTMTGQFYKPMLRTPDGGEHELKIDGGYSQYAGSREFLSGYMQAYDQARQLRRQCECTRWMAPISR